MNTSNRNKILIVDDDILNIKLIQEILKREKYQFAVALNGRTAIYKAKAHKFDLILLDILMPGVDGFEVCKRLHDYPGTKDIPIIFLTALSDIEKTKQGFDVGAVDYVTKPFNKDELLARVKAQIKLKKNREILLETKDSIEIATDLKNESVIMETAKIFTNLNSINALGNSLIKTKLNPEQKKISETILNKCNKTKKQLEEVIQIIRISIEQIISGEPVTGVDYKADKIITKFIEQAEKKLRERNKEIAKKLTILIAEDNIMVQKLTENNLKKLGHTVDVAENGKQAVDKFRTGKYDMIFMDCQMPEMDGFKATIAIREIEKEKQVSPGIQIIAMTAGTKQSERKMCIDAGMDDFLEKPFKVQELLEKL